MPINIERLLRMTADYHNFCSDDFAKGNMRDSDELSAEDLDLVAAATGVPGSKLDEDEEAESIIR